MLKLRCAFQTYEWGKLGRCSGVFQLLESQGRIEELDCSKPYAELWMGSHPSGQSFLESHRQTSLLRFISDFPDCLGAGLPEKSSLPLPFLFKVLSIRKALSIQVHPSKSQAEELHALRPELYKDPNHKPELAIALTPFEALLAFRHPSEIALFCQGIPELLQIVGSECVADLFAVAEQEECTNVAIKAAYQTLMKTDEELVASLVTRLRERLLSGDRLLADLPVYDNDYMVKISEVFVRLATDYPGDVGCFNLFFLNYIVLEPGQAVFLEANLPHAYLSGDCVECMACSDNVVRAGLTSKYKDIDCLLSMLLYEPRSKEELRFPGQNRPIEKPLPIPLAEPTKTNGEATAQPEIITFAPPTDDFAVDKIIVPSSCRVLELLPVASASILIFISGSGVLQQLPTPQPSKSKENAILHPDPSQHEQLRQAEQREFQTQDGHLPAGRIHAVLEFERGTVVFLAANITVCIFPDPSPSPGVDPDASSSLAFRAYANLPCEPSSSAQL
ncbi:unnamed protein product [Dicrocoelium dendriticum]|nr:unnamed protein product [Dicrocoelium dendriticum]